MASSIAALSRRVTLAAAYHVELQRKSPRRAAQRRDLLQLGRGEDHHRELAPALQHKAPTLISGLQTASSCGRLVAGFATRNRFAGHASPSTKTRYALRLKPDHSIGAGHRRAAGNRSLGDQQGREFSPSIPTTRSGDASLPADAKFAEVRFRARPRLRPFQPGAQPHPTSPSQGKPRRCSHRVARSLR